MGNSVFVVIPVFNRKGYTRKCLASFKKQDTDQFSLIVVDDNSPDGTGEMIRREFPDTILLEGNGDLWWVGSINKGIQHALSICQ
ncbi:MAG: glycosyltransferase family 2 protein, partial [Anaerolineales bacterium]